MIKKLGLETHDHPSPYSLGWVDKEAKIKVTNQYIIKFSISVDFIDKVEFYVVSLNVCGVLFWGPYIYMWDTTFMRITN